MKTPDKTEQNDFIEVPLKDSETDKSKSYSGEIETTY